MKDKPVSSKQQEVQRIAEVLAKAIAQHRLRPGVRLVEAHIVEIMQANRNHVQAALQRLAMQRIVDIEPNRGATVAQPSAREAREIFAARRAVERAIVEAISPARIAEHQARIEQHMHDERAATASTDRRAIVRELCEFHLLLGEVSGNQVLADILDNLMVRSSLIVALYQRGDSPPCASHEHQAIIDALRAGDTQAAVGQMIEHLDELEGQLAIEEADAADVNLRQALSGL
ncbi:MAG: GntR family transcriptional regulator [Pseudomonas sp.]